MRLKFFLMGSLIVLICHNTQVMAVGASNLKISCAQRLLVPIGDKSVLADGVLEEIASAYVDAIWTSIVDIHNASSGSEEVNRREQAYLQFKEKVMNELKWRVHDEFVANLRSKHFLLGRYDRASNVIQEFGVSQLGADLVIGIGLAVPVMLVLRASWSFLGQSDLGLISGLLLPPAAIGVLFVSAYRNAETRIQGQSEELSLQFREMVTVKLREKLSLVISSEATDGGEREDQAWWGWRSERRDTQGIIEDMYWHLERKKRMDRIKEESNLGGFERN